MGDKEKISTFLDLINSQVKTGLLSFLEDSYSKNNFTLNTFLGSYTDKVLSFRNIRKLSGIIKISNESKSKPSTHGGSKKISLKGGTISHENMDKLILLYKQIVDYCPSELDIYYILLQEAGEKINESLNFEKIGLPLLKHSHKNYNNIKNVFISNSSKSLSDELKDLYNMNGDDSLNLMQNNHQFMAASFLNRNSAMRGLVIYHGLGSGKTATAVTATLGHSLNKKTIILLPASIEKNFYADLTKFSNISQYTKCRWYIYGVNTRKADGKSSKTNTKLFGKYLKEMGVGMSEKQINEICKYTNETTTCKSKLKLDFYPKLCKDILVITDHPKWEYGYILLTEQIPLGHHILDFLTYMKYTGETKKKSSGIIPNKIEQTEPLYDSILRWIHFLFETKYMFIHIDGGSSPITQLLLEFCDTRRFDEQLLKFHNEIKDGGGLENSLKYEFAEKNNRLIMSGDILIRLVDDLILTGNNPLDNKFMIIDEAHRLVSYIMNGSINGLAFYKLIMNAKNMKLMCLSGTPCINNNYEIGLLCNMVYGMYNGVLVECTSGPHRTALKTEINGVEADINKYILCNQDRGANHLLIYIVPEMYVKNGDDISIIPGNSTTARISLIEKQTAIIDYLNSYNQEAIDKKTITPVNLTLFDDKMLSKPGNNINKNRKRLIRESIVSFNTETGIDTDNTEGGQTVKVNDEFKKKLYGTISFFSTGSQHT